ETIESRALAYGLSFAHSSSELASFGWRHRRCRFGGGRVVRDSHPLLGLLILLLLRRGRARRRCRVRLRRSTRCLSPWMVQKRPEPLQLSSQQSLKPVGVGAASQLLIPTDERPGLLTHTAATESVSLCERMKC